MPLILACIGFLASANSPQVLWTFEAQSNLYAPPLVADVCPNPGLETVISDADVRRLRCIDAQGRQLWEYDGGWRKRLTSSAALSFTVRPGFATLAIGNSDGTLACVDAATGSELWQKPLGVMEWGGAMWADLTGDGRDELVAGTEDSGIFALDANGKQLWHYAGGENDRLLIRCPLAAADIDGDGKSEIFAANRFGPLCLKPDGTLRWKTYLGDDFFSSPLVADPRGQKRPVVYCASTDADAFWTFDAADGTQSDLAALAGATGAYSGSSMAVGDIDQDGKAEAIVPTDAGHVYCFGADGRAKWVFQTDGRVHAAVSLGDVDGDGAVDVLVASGDHNLYCVDNRGAEKWRHACELRLIHPATIADIDGDGRTDILVCGSDRKLLCLTVGGAYSADRVPWPSRRFDVAQSGSAYGRVSPWGGVSSPTAEQVAAQRGDPERVERRATVDTITVERVLPINGGFEQRRQMGDEKDYPPRLQYEPASLYTRMKNQPCGWVQREPPGMFPMNECEKPFEGGQFLSVENSMKFAMAVTEPIEVEPEMYALRVKAAVMPLGLRDAGLTVTWSGLQGHIYVDWIADVALAINEWNVVERKLRPPKGARWFQIGCYVHDGRKALFDAVEVTGVYEVPKTAEVFINQVGYDTGMPKKFTVSSNFVAKQAKFELVGEDGAAVISGVLSHEGRIVGAYGSDWGSEYWRGDFTKSDTPGKYRIRIMLDGLIDLSWPFEIGKDLIFARTSRPAYRFFYYQRCGMAIPGFHQACHLDDAVGPDGTQYELWGGWHDAGDYNTYHNAPYVFGLATAYAVKKAAFDAQDADANGVGDFFDEILWGGRHSRRMMAPDGSAYGRISSGYGFWGLPELETDNLPGTGDERRLDAGPGCDSAYHAAAMAKIARLLAPGDDRAAYVEAAERGLAWALSKNMRGPLQFSAAVDLFAATGDGKYSALARELLPSANVDVLESVLLYDALFNENNAAAMKDALVKRADEILALAQNPFGVYTFGPPEKPNFFNTPPSGGGWHVGTSSHILGAAQAVAKAYKYQPELKYLQFIYDQLNWTLGNNPFDLSLMEGCGSRFLPTYHHRYAFSGVARGAVPGSVVNGITWRTPGDDRPYLDLRGLDIPDFQPNEVWLPHNTAWLGVLAWMRAG
ncbi:MAG TPA: glycoside hydrolase family 9 protein [Candidatus Bathyarchaeia archaeon]|nr:glycoside hydrolase family 9 protein [Candidatus Bathyarchaeia archaeon]